MGVRNSTVLVLLSLVPVSVAKARVLRCLSQALLLSPLRREARLAGRSSMARAADERDWQHGVPVVRLPAMLRGCDLSGCDLRGVDLHRADLRGVDLSGADLGDAHLAGADLSRANLDRCCLEGARLCFGRPQTATPQQPGRLPELTTGAGSGAVVMGSTLRGARRLDLQKHDDLVSWGSPRLPATLPGGWRGIADQHAGSGG